MDSRAERVPFRANRTSMGTTPVGSQWTKNPIPACGSAGGGYMEKDGLTCNRLVGTQFPPPANNLTGGVPLQGFCEAMGTNWRADCNFAIYDTVRVPADLAPGEYVLGFRWDCEQTPQVWTTCSSIRVTAPRVAV